MKKEMSSTIQSIIILVRQKSYLHTKYKILRILLTYPFFFKRKKYYDVLCLFFYSVVIQSYEAEADNEYIIRGNSAIMKCEIPSFVADFVYVDSWEDSDENTYLYNNMSRSGSLIVVVQIEKIL